MAGGSCQTRKNMLQARHLEQSQTDPLSAYGWMRVLSQAHRRESPAKAFLSISQSMGGHVTPDAQLTPRIDRDADSLLAIVPLQGLSESRYLRNGQDRENDGADHYP